jgi:hypothetical protein
VEGEAEEGGRDLQSVVRSTAYDTWNFLGVEDSRRYLLSYDTAREGREKGGKDVKSVVRSTVWEAWDFYGVKIQVVIFWVIKSCHHKDSLLSI